MNGDGLSAAASSLGFQLLPGESHYTLKLVGTLNPKIPELFEVEMEELQKAPYKPLIINCANLSYMPKTWVRSLLAIDRKLKSVNMAMRFILVSEAIREMFKKEGVDAAFQVSPNLREAMVEMGLTNRKALDVDFINPFLSATVKVLRVQASTAAVSGKMRVKTGKNKFLGDISGVIGLVSATFTGAVVISFPEATFLQIVSRMLGEPVDKVTEEVEDGAGELTNIIFGQAKIALNEKGYGINTALPSVVTGKEHAVTSLTAGPVVVIPFETDVGPFYVEICLSS